MRAGQSSPFISKFILLTFTLSWLIWIPLVMAHFGIGPLHVPEEISSLVRLLGVLMPAVSALFVIARTGGSTALRNLFSRLGIWRVGLTWWTAAILIQPLLLGLVALGFNHFGGTPPVTPQALPPVGALAINIFFLLLATLGEEIGWRGLALPVLLQRNTPLRSSMILSLIWASWHLPFWLLLDTFDQYGVSYLGLNFLFVFPLTLYITWFFIHGRSSLLLVAAFHLVFNIVNTIWLPVTVNVNAFGWLIILEWALALPMIPQMQTNRGTSDLPNIPYRNSGIP